MIAGPRRLREQPGAPSPLEQTGSHTGISDHLLKPTGVVSRAQDLGGRHPVPTLASASGPFTLLEASGRSISGAQSQGHMVKGLYLYTRVMQVIKKDMPMVKR